MTEKENVAKFMDKLKKYSKTCGTEDVGSLLNFLYMRL